MSAPFSNIGLDESPLPRFSGRIREKNANHKLSGPIVIVAFGDSVTMGATSQDAFAPEDVYHQRLKRMLAKAIPGPAGATLSMVNSGCGGDTATIALNRIDRDVIRYQPDLVIVAFGANDLNFDPQFIQTFETSMRQIVEIILARTSADIVLLTPTHMVSRESENVLAPPKDFMRVLMRLQNEGFVAQYADVARKIGREEKVAVADVYARWDELAASGVDTTSMLANGLNHPVAEMHEIPAKEIFKIITVSFTTPTTIEQTNQ